MAPPKRLRNRTNRKMRKDTRIRKRRYPKTVRGHRHSTFGRILPPLDVRNPKQLNHIIERITKGPVTVMVVYADWCGHCHKLMPHLKAAANMPQRNVQVLSIRDDMLSGYNKMVNSVNRSASPIEVDGYPSVLLVGPNGEKLSEIAPTKEALDSAMVNVAPVAVEAGLAPAHSLVSIHNRNAVKPRNGSSDEVLNNIVTNELISTNANRNVSMNKSAMSFEHLPNDTIIRQNEPMEEDVIEEIIEKKPVNNRSMNQSLDVGVSPMVNNIQFSTNANARRPSSNRMIIQSVPHDAIRTKEEMNNKGNGTLSRSEAEEITSLQAEPVSPGIGTDTRPIKAVVGGSRGANRGGSLYGIMTQTAYRLAPAAVLLATAAAVMKKKKHTKKRHGFQRSTRKRHH